MKTVEELRPLGYIRRIDQLGRIVLPKEIRDLLDLKEGMLVETYLIQDGLVLKRHYEKNKTSVLLQEISQALEGVEPEKSIYINEHLEAIKHLL